MSHCGLDLCSMFGPPVVRSDVEQLLGSLGLPHRDDGTSVTVFGRDGQVVGEAWIGDGGEWLWRVGWGCEGTGFERFIERLRSEVNDVLQQPEDPNPQGTQLATSDAA